MSERPWIFTDRHDAGRRLATALRGYVEQDPIVLALPRGGVPVAYEVDVRSPAFTTRKICQTANSVNVTAAFSRHHSSRCL